MKPLVFLVLVGGVCCMSHMQVPLSSSTSGEDVGFRKLQERETHPLSNIPETTEYIRTMDLFKSKVGNRLDTSNIFANQPALKQRLLTIAVEKFRLCERSIRGNRSCLATVTGQVMSLIAGYERSQIQDW